MSQKSIDEYLADIKNSISKHNEVTSLASKARAIAISHIPADCVAYKGSMGYGMLTHTVLEASKEGKLLTYIKATRQGFNTTIPGMVRYPDHWSQVEFLSFLVWDGFDIVEEALIRDTLHITISW